MSNESTRVDPLFRDSPCRASTAMAAAASVVEAAPLGPDAPLAVAVVDMNGRLVGTAVARHDAPLIIGRHEQCGLRIADHRVGLRQLAILPVVAAGGVQTRLWDLRTELPMHTLGRELATAITATGSFAVTFGSWTVVARAFGTLESVSSRCVASSGRHSLLLAMAQRRSPESSRWLL
ncbi:MAG: hypothetical protein JST54_27930 [Deltaproteobacteria bacterium]|nr:hypothetical protein [Deltaproteobacteria bacterium]